MRYDECNRRFFAVAEPRAWAERVIGSRNECKRVNRRLADAISEGFAATSGLKHNVGQRKFL